MFLRRKGETATLLRSTSEPTTARVGDLLYTEDDCVMVYTNRAILLRVDCDECGVIPHVITKYIADPIAFYEGVMEEVNRLEFVDLEFVELDAVVHKDAILSHGGSQGVEYIGWSTIDGLVAARKKSKNRPTKTTPLTQAPTLVRSPLMATTTAIFAKATKDIAAIMKKAEADVKALEAKAAPVAAKATKGKGASSKSASSSSDDEKDLATKVRDAVEAALNKSKAKNPAQSYYNVVTGKTCVRRGDAKSNVFYSKNDLHICAPDANAAAKALKELGMTKAHLVVDEEKKAKAPTKKAPVKDAEADDADADASADADDASADAEAVSDD